MQLEYMRCFIVLCHFRSISKTGAYFHTTPQNISRIVKRMEDELSTSLIHRTSKGIIVTTQGENFLKLAKQMVYRYDALRSEFLLEQNQANQKHLVTLYSQDIANQLFLNDILPQFADYYPMITVNNVITGYTEGYHYLCTDPMAIGTFLLFEEDLNYTGLEINPILQSPIVACVNKQHPLAKQSFIKLSDLESYKQVFFVRNNLQSSGLKQKLDGISISDHYISGSINTCFNMAIKSNYVFCDLLVLYLHQSRQVQEQLIAIPIVDHPEKTLALLTHSTLPIDSPQKLLSNFILSKISEIINEIIE